METKAKLTPLDSDDASLDLWKGELCILASNDNVAVQDYLRPSAVRTAVHSSNHRLGSGESSGEGCETVRIADDVALVRLRPAPDLSIIPSAKQQLSSVPFHTRPKSTNVRNEVRTGTEQSPFAS